MTEIPGVTQSAHNMGENVARTVEYEDGSINVVIDKIGTAIDLSQRLNKHLDFNNPSSFMGFTTVDYDGNKRVYVPTQSGYGDSVLLTYPKDGKPSYSAGELFSHEWTASLTEAPLTVGARHGRFNNEKLMSVEGLRSVGVSVDGSNPLTVAEKILAQRQGQ